MIHRRTVTLALALALGVLAASELQAQAVISNGKVTLGVNKAGHLILDPDQDETGGSFGLNPLTGRPYGLSVGDGSVAYEGLAWGSSNCCEGWGVGVSGGTYDGEQDGFDAGVAGSPDLPWYDGVVAGFSSTASTATSIVDIMAGALPIMRITHHYAPALYTDLLYEVTVTIENTSGGSLGTGSAGIRYRRLMDWDVQPTAFSELVTMWGRTTTTSLLQSSNDPFFASPPPFVGDPVPDLCPDLPALPAGDFTDWGPCDQGALFDFGFAALDPGGSVSFKTFYGGAVGASAEIDVLKALETVGAETFSLAQCDPANPACNPATGAPVTMAFAFRDVGGVPYVYNVVPEPGTWFLLATGLVGLALARRRRKDELTD